MLDQLAPLMPAGVVAVAESGLRDAADLQRLARAGYDAFLIGERFMAEPDPGAALRDAARRWTAMTRASRSAASRRVEDALLAARARRDAIGLRLLAREPARSSTRDAGAAIVARAAAVRQRVGVFVDQARARGARGARGRRSAPCSSTATRSPGPTASFRCRVIKAVAVHGRARRSETRRRCRRPRRCCSTRTIRSSAAARDARSTGRSPRPIARARPVILSGGLNAENVAEAIATVRAVGRRRVVGRRSWRPAGRIAAKLRAFFAALDAVHGAVTR